MYKFTVLLLAFGMLLLGLTVFSGVPVSLGPAWIYQTAAVCMLVMAFTTYIAYRQGHASAGLIALAFPRALWITGTVLYAVYGFLGWNDVILLVSAILSVTALVKSYKNFGERLCR